jgi:RimJ/RimL family protein N-acetyltransferase
MFERSLYGGPLGTLCQFVILPKTDKSQLAGLVMAYGATLQDGYCYLGVMIDSKFQGGALEGVALFIRYLFDHWPFRKIYLETVEYDLQQFQSAVSSGLFREEGRLRAHQYFRDQYWDVHLLAAYREDLHKFTQQFSTIFLPEAISTDKSSSHDNR